MCGILLCTLENYQNLTDFDKAALNNRGPNYSSVRNFCFRGLEYIGFCSVLSLQGVFLYPQPAEFSDFILLWNGEIYNHGSATSDTHYLVDKLATCDGSIEAVIGIFNDICGPFAFILVQRSVQRIYFGRDRFGRRSLVCNADLSYLGSLCCSDAVGFMEVPASGIYVAAVTPHGGFSLKSWYSWSENHMEYWLRHPFNMSFEYQHVLKWSKCETLQKLEKCPPVDALRNLLKEAVSIRVSLGSPCCQICFKSDTESLCSHARIGVLFSGALDSTVVAALVDRCLSPDQPIDLINVAFQHLQGGDQRSNRRRNGEDGLASQQKYAPPNSAPDRQTALASFEELQRLNPQRHWHLVLADVSVEELKKARQERVRNLLKPSPETTLNDSLALALWFAARGRGRVICSQSAGCPMSRRGLDYVSPSRVLLTGMGADEQLAGYSRHRNTFVQHGPQGVEEELALEMQRIAERNLGRDDRIISDHGREARYPFLDEGVVQYLASLPLQSKADLTLPRGVGEKQLLRAVAASLGLDIAARLPKRALQFGSRVAKSESLHKVVGADSNLIDAD